MSGVKISTITMSCKLPDCELNLVNIGKYLEIDDEIIGIKYKYAQLNVTKGKYSTTIYKKAKIKDEDKINKNLFYNQITLIINNNGNHVNVKLFSNGSLHLTGCKTTDESIKIVEILYRKLDNLRGKKDILLLTKDQNGILLDKDNLVYGESTFQVIGHTSDWNTYVIHKKEYEIDMHTELFIAKKIETKRKKPILNLDGENIGFWQIELLKNKNKLYRNNCNIFYDTLNGMVYFNNTSIIGKFIYNIDTNKVNKNNNNFNKHVFEIDYDCNPFINKNYKLPEMYADKLNTDINCINIYFKLDFCVNRQRFYEILIDREYICKYRPESYSGIKLIYKLAIDNISNNGFCNCNKKCTCRNITFLIFQSGNVIATGFKNEIEITECTTNFLNLCQNIKDKIVKREIN
jgi:TATA-box binding protein (TBP) (component of TFIID and TFIIIB)